MSTEFDPYHKWLGIPPRDQPADHYRLLGVDRLENDMDVISSAADQRMNFLRQFQNGERTHIAQQLLNEIAAARVCLLDADKKAVYDRNLEQETSFSLSETAIADNENLAATTEFTSEDTPEWPTEPIAGSLVGVDWAAEGDSKSKNQETGIPSHKTKMRIKILSVLSTLAALLLLGVMLAGASRNSRERPNDKMAVVRNVASRPPAAPENQETKIESPRPDERRAEADPQQADRDDKKKAQEEAGQEAEEKKEAEQKAKEAADHKAKQDAERKAQQEAEREAQKAERRQRASELRNKVDQSVDEAMRLKESPRKSLGILERIFIEVDNAELRPGLHNMLKEKIQGAADEIRLYTDRQQAKEAEEALQRWRTDHPEEYLESLELAREKNGWQIEAVLELSELSKPLTKSLLEYQKNKTVVQKKASQIEHLENKLLTDMQRLPGAFSDPGHGSKFREWILDGMQEYPDARKPIRRRVDLARKEFDRFRKQAPGLANRLEQRLHELQLGKNELQDYLDSLADTRRRLEDLDARSHDLKKSIERTEETLDREREDFETALRSTGLSLKEPNLRNVEKLLNRANEILSDHPHDESRDES